ncbi:MAG: protein-tyrosine-phosphatase [Cyclobacteriaceae bacterium]
MFYPLLSNYIEQAIDNASQLAPNRRELLASLSKYIADHKKHCLLTFICTHNSRRSHFGQIWAHVAAVHYGLSGVETYSGGTEATAFHPHAIAAIQRAGIQVEPVYASSIPKVRLTFGDNVHPIEVCSKVYDDPANPQNGFAAIMTCAEADEGCPVVHGADVKIPLHYQDPKISDGTDQQDQTYDERCFQIATEMCCVFSQAAS